MLRIAVEDPNRLLTLIDDVDSAVAGSAASRGTVAVLLEQDAREVPDTELVRAVDAAVRSGEAPRPLRALADRVARLDLTWDDVLDLQRPARDGDVATARADLVDAGLARLTHLRIEIEEL